MLKQPIFIKRKILMFVFILSFYACSTLKKPTSPEPIKVLLTEEVLSKTSLDLSLNQTYCTQTPKTVVGSGSDKCLTLVEKKGKPYLLECSHRYHGANYAAVGYNSSVDSVVVKTPVLIEGCLIRTQSETYTASICQNELVIKAVVPSGNNTWIYSNNHVEEIYEFDKHPLKVKEGIVKIRTLTKSQNLIYEFLLLYSTTTDKFGSTNIKFSNSTEVIQNVYFENLIFSTETISNEVGIKESEAFPGNYIKRRHTPY